MRNEAGPIPVLARKALHALLGQLDELGEQISDNECHIHAEHRSNEASRRLETIPGIGVIGATAIAAMVPDPMVFKSGREFAAWIGLVPRQNSSGGKERLGSTSKQGDRYLSRHLAEEHVALHVLLLAGVVERRKAESRPAAPRRINGITVP